MEHRVKFLSQQTRTGLFRHVLQNNRESKFEYSVFIGRNEKIGL